MNADEPRKPTPHPDATPLTRAWGRAIWEQRVYVLKMTQVDFAEHLGTTQAQVSQWETGRSAPGPHWQPIVIERALFPPELLARIYREARAPQGDAASGKGAA